VIFARVDWAEAHHDVCVMGEDGTVLGQRRVSHSVAGIGELPGLIAAELGCAATTVRTGGTASPAAACPRCPAAAQRPP